MESPDPNAERKDNRPGGRISLQTLIVASVASAAASFAASRIWGPGTLISAAATPVVVALVSEFLRRPVQTVAATAKRVPTVPTFGSVRQHTIAAPDDPTDVAEDPTRARPGRASREEPQSRSAQPQPDPRFEPPAAVPPVADPGTIKADEASTWRPRWRLAVVTGLVAFAVVVALYTLPDILAGRSITGNGAPTTFFGGSATAKKKAGPKTTVTTAAPTTTVTKTASTTTTTKTTTTPTTPTTTTPTSTSTTTPTTSTTLPAVSSTTTPTTTAP